MYRLKKRVSRSQRSATREVIPLPIDRRAGDTIRKRMTYTVNITSGGAGSFSAQFTSASPFSLPANEFGSFSARYVDYRVLKISVMYVPFFPIQTATAAHDALLMAEDPSGALTPTTLVPFFSIKRCAVGATFRVMKFSAKASEEEHLLWNPTSAAIPAANRFAVLVAAGNLLTNATGYGRFFVHFDVELRGSQ
jgi:hypothetical protein